MPKGETVVYNGLVGPQSTKKLNCDRPTHPQSDNGTGLKTNILQYFVSKLKLHFEIECRFPHKQQLNFTPSDYKHHWNTNFIFLVEYKCTELQSNSSHWIHSLSKITKSTCSCFVHF